MTVSPLPEEMWQASPVLRAVDLQFLRHFAIHLRTCDHLVMKLGAFVTYVHFELCFSLYTCM